MTCSASIGEQFRAYLPEGNIRDLWETESGLAFVQRERIEAGAWQAYGPQPAGMYHIFVPTVACRMTATYNGRIRHSGVFPAKSVHFSAPDAEVRSTGCGSFKALQVSFNPGFLASHLESLLVNPDAAELRDLPSTTDVGLAYLSQIYESVSASGIPVTRLYFDIIRQAMFDRIVLRHISCPIKPGLEMLVPARVRRVIDYIEANLARDLRLVELSAVAGISRSHFARAFRHTVGMAPHTFVLQRRLARAVEWVMLRTLPMSEVAARCGFADHAHLTRAFKRQFGHPPSVHIVN